MKNPRSSLLHTYQRLGHPELLSLRWRLGILTVCLLLYLVLFFWLHPIFDGAVSAFSAIPIIAAAWFFGFRVANIAFLSVFLLNYLLYSNLYGFDVERFVRNNGLTGALFLLACGAFIGHMSDLRKKALEDLQTRKTTEMALLSNQAHLQALYQNIQDAVLFVDDQARIIEVNPSACRLFGLSHDELIGMEFCKFCEITSANQKDFFWQEFLLKGHYHGEVSLHCKSESSIIVELLAISAVLPTENVIFLHDITQTRLAEKEVNRLLEAERSNRSLAEALIFSSSVLNSTLDLDDVLNQILLSVGLVVPHTAANIMLIEGDRARVVKAKGYEIYHQTDYILTVTYPIADCFNLRFLAEQAVPIAIRNTTTDPRWIKSSELSWIGSYAAAPIIIEDNVIGFLNLDSNTENLYTQEHADRLMAFANQAAIAIRNAKLYNQVQEKARQTTLLSEITQVAISASTLSEMAQVLADRLLQLFEAYGAYITLWDDNHQKPIPTAASGYLQNDYTHLTIAPDEYTLTHLVLEKGVPVIIPEIGQFPGISSTLMGYLKEHAILVLPLTADAIPLGAAIIVFPSDHEITPSEVILGELTCSQISLAFAKARLLTTEQTRLAETGRTNQLLSVLGRMAARIASANDLETIFSTLGDELKEIGVYCLVGLKENETNNISIRYFSRLYPIPEKYQGYLKSFNTFNTLFPLFPLIMEQHTPVFVVDPIPLVHALLERFPQHIQSQLIPMIGFGPETHAICLPLIADADVVGIITLWGDDIRESDQPAAQIFTSQVAIAIQKAKLMAEIQQMAITDELTGVYNRRGLYERGQIEIDRSRRFNHPVSMLFVDIDLFKNINDQFGHNIGDQVLQQIAQRIRKNVRELDVIGRYGGDEFLVLLVESNLDDAITIADRLLLNISELSFSTSSGPLTTTLSIGIAELNDLDADLDSLIVRSDQLLYLAKESGRNRIVY
jgi:diguanylate cyclase (GGDEF)-like protein/PAS domain S-box-containing protein